MDGFQPLPPIGDSRKKKGGGEICACFRTTNLLLAEEIPHLGNFCGGWLPAAVADRRQPQKKGGGSGHFDHLTVISPSTRKSPGAAGALSLTPDGVSDPAEGATAQPSEAIPPVAKQGGDAKQGKRERTRRGSVQFDHLTVISPSTRKSPGAAGALSLTPDGVSDPAAASGPRPSEAIPPVAKQGGDAKRGEGEASKAGERAV